MHSLAGSEGAGSGQDPHRLTWWRGGAREKLDQTPGDFSAMARNLGASSCHSPGPQPRPRQKEKQHERDHELERAPTPLACPCPTT